MESKRLPLIGVDDCRVPRRSTHMGYLRGVAVVVLVALGVMQCGVAMADTYDVTKPDDTADGTCDSDCSLREAIIVANQHPGPDTVVLPAGTYVLTLAGAGEDQAATGDLDILDDLTIRGAGADSTRIDGNGSDRIFQISGPAVQLSGLTLQNGVVAGDSGGGIFNGGTLTLEDCTLRGNSAADNGGGGIFNSAGATASLANCKLSGNSAYYGGGIANFRGGTLTLENCTVSGNSADFGGGGGIGNSGTATLTMSTLSENSTKAGGGGIGNIGTATLANCTLSGNSAASGGGIGGPGTARLTNCTLSNNSAFNQGGGIFNFGDASATILANTIVANTPTGGNCAGSNPVQSNGHNLDDDGTCNLISTGDLPNVPAHLAPLGDNGGLTPTTALLPDSPAINAGDEAVCESPPVNGVDQRGYVRPGAGYANCSIGAYEYNSSPPISACIGDCDGSGGVTVNELITLVNIAVGNAPPSGCQRGVPSGTAVDIALIIKAVNGALTGCGGG